MQIMNIFYFSIQNNCIIFFSVVRYGQIKEGEIFKMKNVKKILIAVMAVILTVGCVCAFAACNKDQGVKVKVLDVDLSSEQYAFAVKKGDTALLNSVNEFFVAKKTEINILIHICLSV